MKCKIIRYTYFLFLLYLHNSLIPRVAYFLLPLKRKQEASWGWNFTICISEVKVNQLKVNYTHAKIGSYTFKKINHERRDISSRKWRKFPSLFCYLIISCYAAYSIIITDIDFCPHGLWSWSCVDSLNSNHQNCGNFTLAHLCDMLEPCAMVVK